MRFSTIVADPPWDVKAGRKLGAYVMRDGLQVFGGTNGDMRSRELAYPKMTVQQIAALQVPANKDCHLYLWAINKYLRDAFDVAASWGFQFSTMLTWAKNPMGGGLGGVYGISSEYVLFCRRGSLNATDRVTGTWFNWKRPYTNGYPKHSAKPPEFYEMVERVSPGPRLEMFARSKRDNWAAWGNEIQSDIEIPTTPGGNRE